MQSASSQVLCESDFVGELAERRGLARASAEQLLSDWVSSYEPRQPSQPRPQRGAEASERRPLLDEVA